MINVEAPVHTYGETENAVAIMDCIGDWAVNNVQISDALEGRAGVYSFVIKLGIALDRVVADDMEKEDFAYGWERYNWYLTTEAIGAKIKSIEAADDLPYSEKEFDDFVSSCLQDA